MLVVKVKLGKEKVMIGGARVSVLGFSGNSAILGFEADKSTEIKRTTEEYQWRGKSKKESDQKQNLKNQSALECTQATLKRLKHNSSRFRNSSTKQYKNLSDCFLCYPDSCGCNV